MTFVQIRLADLVDSEKLTNKGLNMRHICYFLFLAVIWSATITNYSSAQDVIWTGSGDGSHWSDPLNWFPETVPLFGNVGIPDPDAVVLVDYTLGMDIPILDTLICEGSVIVDAWEFVLFEQSNIDKDFSIFDGAQVEVRTNPVFPTGLTVGGNLLIGESLLYGNGPITVAGDATIIASYLQDDGPITIFGHLEASNVIDYERDFHTWGTVRVVEHFQSGTPIPVWYNHASCTATFINGFTQFMTIENEGHMLFGQNSSDVTEINGPFASYDGSSVHVITGEAYIRSQAGPARADFYGNIIVDNSGDLFVETEATIWETANIAGEGTMHLIGHGATQVHTGLIGLRRLSLSSNDAGHTTEFTSDFSIRELEVDTWGRLIGPANITVELLFEFNLGAVAGSGTIFNLGDLNISDIGGTTIGDTRILWNSGIAVLDGGGGLMLTGGDGDGALYNDPIGSFTVQGEGEIGVAIINDGIFQKNSPDPLAITGPIDQHGTFLLNSGVTTCTAGGTWSGNIEVTAGATLRVEGAARTFETDANLFGEGTLQLNFGTTHVFCDIDVAQTEVIFGDHYFYNDIAARRLALTAGQIRGPGTLNVESIFTCDGGNMYDGVVNTNDTAILQNSSSFTLGNHDLNLNANTIWSGNGIIGWNGDGQITNNGVFNIQNSSECRQPFANYNEIVKSQGDVSLFSRGIYTEGQVDILAGTIKIEAGQVYYQESGATVLAGGVLDPYANSPAQIAGGVLMGGGTVDGGLVLGAAATITPGELSTDIITITDDYTQQPLGTYICELGGTVPGTGHDQVVVYDQANLAGMLRVQLVDGYVPAAGTALRVLTAGTINGQFDQIDPPGNLPDGMSMQVIHESSSVIVLFENTVIYDLQMITGNLIDGDLTSLQQSDDSYVHVHSPLIGWQNGNLHNIEIQISAVTNTDEPSTIDLAIETRLNRPVGAAEIRLLNYDTGEFEMVGTLPVTGTDVLLKIEDIDASQYVSSNNEIELRIKYMVVGPTVSNVFESFLDKVVIDVN